MTGMPSISCTQSACVKAANEFMKYTLPYATYKGLKLVIRENCYLDSLLLSTPRVERSQIFLGSAEEGISCTPQKRSASEY